MSATIIDGKAIAATMRKGVAARAGELADKGWQPKLVSLSVGDVAAAELYVRNQQKSAHSAGVDFEARNYDADTSLEQLTGIIQGLNADPRVNGIIIQRPLPDHIPVKTLQKLVHPLKDVEGMHPASIGNIVYNDLALGPCTAVAAVEILKTLPLDIEGLNVAVIGHSEIVGKPIAFLLMGLGATVTVCHHMTRSVAMHSRAADAVFVAVGKPGLVTGEMLKPGCVVIDIGINRVDGKTVGDADYESCKDVAGWITPVPGGVGPVTVATLMSNAVHATEMQMNHYRDAYARTDF
ncbi:bifunctional 5,10-methylenetetrahydrofolate dehydrogenase/5,10-methenyltetrahydrofolate cyclohydrolase [Sulfitobacter mediterraneus]|jgi:methylenetetrahydrofolate dehydrogenase (NADP+) / methenyltetrahydrofolate cyclohydrolase|uniref:bifunctional 5,10-methylenetetrahydrofolate dehydrogenase/5,10-methenyltetrahydrofolate cyclohydrolase n=1 Tax=Sulfitobacter TaxID=60136 RepID=UPI001933E718|nr:MULTISPECIES: bifunctional 5,10-methylenetetrahydrofolate dehydrogenase/5,10-methenyltetrahydrofolate cyclohydrolase [Sulfitobacter]MBM1631244.1 bifunctional 5,10-methylenetetrahydrofolate dehydrogenase/5,10-methenyltetrahydrofolate cyclohydrolase [Sulfitobacter mediterraneus]MBM1639057.1 bifunctional 5,10-methylenetetrahydrofolate dehydrogenase/5,10-methenyltetrahydrofolate cyclohydrolase [Sulfitobacter mediterraneus]MBM1643106.1 bifunctional 5,10-methylenetetrahydrofolate dehydrogenase/5,10